MTTKTVFFHLPHIKNNQVINQLLINQVMHVEVMIQKKECT